MRHPLRDYSGIKIGDKRPGTHLELKETFLANIYNGKNVPMGLFACDCGRETSKMLYQVFFAKRPIRTCGNYDCQYRRAYAIEHAKAMAPNLTRGRRKGRLRRQTEQAKPPRKPSSSPGKPSSPSLPARGVIASPIQQEAPQGGRHSVRIGKTIIRSDKPMTVSHILNSVAIAFEDSLIIVEIMQ